MLLYVLFLPFLLYLAGDRRGGRAKGVEGASRGFRGHLREPLRAAGKVA